MMGLVDFMVATSQDGNLGGNWGFEASADYVFAILSWSGLGIQSAARFMSKNGEGNDESFSKCKLSKSSADADRNPVLFGIVGTPYVRERVF